MLQISAAATAINTNLNVGWRTLSSGLGFKSATPAPAGSSPADAPKQEPDAAVEASGSRSRNHEKKCTCLWRFS